MVHKSRYGTQVARTAPPSLSVRIELLSNRIDSNRIDSSRIDSNIIDSSRTGSNRSISRFHGSVCWFHIFRPFHGCVLLFRSRVFLPQLDGRYLSASLVYLSGCCSPLPPHMPLPVDSGICSAAFFCRLYGPLCRTWVLLGITRYFPAIFLFLLPFFHACFPFSFSASVFFLIFFFLSSFLVFFSHPVPQLRVV